MKDTYKREIDYLRISVTDRCNLRCLYCMPEGIEKLTHDDIIRDEEIIDIINEAVSIGFKKVRITGGEPLVRKGIYNLIKKIKGIKGIEEIVLTTNGTLLLGNVHKLKESGVSRINLSLDSLKQEKLKRIFNTNTEFNYLSLIEELKTHNLNPIKVNVVLLKGINDSEIMDFYRFSTNHNLEVRFIELMPFESTTFNYEDYYVSTKDILKQNSHLIFSHRKNNVDYYKTENSDKTIGFIKAISNKFCSECNRLRITSDGYIKPCLHSDKEIKVKGLKKEDVVSKLKVAIHSKQKQHTLDKTYKNESKKSMNKIGG